MNLPIANPLKDELAFYDYLLKSLDGNRCRIKISQSQHIILLEIKKRQLHPFNGYEYGLAIKKIFVNTNWLVRHPTVTEIWDLKYYLAMANGKHAING